MTNEEINQRLDEIEDALSKSPEMAQRRLLTAERLRLQDELRQIALRGRLSNIVTEANPIRPTE